MGYKGSRYFAYATWDAEKYPEWESQYPWGWLGTFDNPGDAQNMCDEAAPVSDRVWIVEEKTYTQREMFWSNQ